jgi:hypothetical protein
MKLHGEEIKVGDKVWHILYGWKTVSRIDSGEYPIIINEYSYNESGVEYSSDINPSIFWDEVHINPPPKPEPEIDWSKVPEGTLVRVWDEEEDSHMIAEYHNYNTATVLYKHLVKNARGTLKYKYCELHESVTPKPEWYK